MPQLYFDCSMGIAGDMLLGALYELIEEKEAFLDELRSLHIPHVTITPQPRETLGEQGVHMEVLVDGEEEGHHHDDHHHHHHHHHHTVADIFHLIDHMTASPQVKEDCKAVYQLLAQAESRAHHAPVEQIHFHEVGTLDALADIAGCCLAMGWLKPACVTASPVHVGSGTVHCAHGELPVPAPATAFLLEGIPTCSTEVKGELCTPTGAALLRYFVSRYEETCPFPAEKTGRGFGTKVFPGKVNCIRVMKG